MSDAADDISGLKKAGLVAGIAVSLLLLAAFVYILVTRDADQSFIGLWRYTALATLGAMVVYQYVSFQVNKARGLHQVPLPEMTGPPHFNRVMRVHLNTLENMPLFLPLLWLFAALWGDVWGGVFGGTWVLGRFLYARGYYRAVELRVTGFGISSTVNLLMLIGCLIGVIGGMF